MSDLSEKRMKELLRSEAKLNALEAGGVDNWEWYGESLKEYHAENELEERLEALLDDLECVFGESAYEPSERGAGIAFTDDLAASAMEIMRTAGVTFTDLLTPND